MPKKKRKGRPAPSTRAQAPRPARTAVDSLTELRTKDARALLDASVWVERATIALEEAIAVLDSTSQVVNIARVRAEATRPRAELTDLYSVLGLASLVLKDDGELATHPSRPVNLGEHISPHQLDMFNNLTELGRDESIPVSEVYRRFDRSLTRPEPRPAVVAETKPKGDLRYEVSLRNELDGNDVGAEVFWAAVMQGACTYCDAEPGRPCMTSGGWPSDGFHRPRRDAAAQAFKRAAAQGTH